MKVGQTDCVKGNLSIVHCHSDKENDLTLRSDKDLSKSTVLNLRIAHEIHGFHSGNPHEI